MAQNQKSGRDRSIQGRWRLVVAVFGLSYGLLVVVAGWFVPDQMTRLAASGAMEAGLAAAQRVGARIQSQVPASAMVGEARIEKIRSILVAALPAEPSLLALEVYDPADGRIVRVGPRIDGVALTDPVVVTIEGLGRLAADVSPALVERRQKEVRAALLVPLGGLLVSGGVLVLVAILWLWRVGESERRAFDRRIHQERLAEVGALAAGLAHEIRNPLNSLRLNLQMVEEGLRENGPAEDLALIEANRVEVGRLERLLDDFLRYARPRPPNRRAVDVVALMRQALDAVEVELEHDSIQVELDAPRPGPKANLDSDQVTQVLLNLFRNAREAMEVRPPGDRRLRLEVCVTAEQEVRIVVADSGCGATGAELARLGELFYSNKKGGTGLGLPIARRVLAEHGGSLRFESAAGRGLRAIMEFPLASSETAG